MASKTNPRSVAALLALLVVLAVVGVIQLRPALLPGVSGETKSPVLGTYKVPKLSVSGGEPGKLDGEKPGRNLFTFGAPPTPTPDMRPTPTPRPTMPPPPPPPPRPTDIWGKMPPPPAFTMSYIGWLGPNRLPVAIFRDGEEIRAVPQGDTVKDKFILRKVDLQEVVIGFVGYPEMVTTKIPLAK